jgi:hypothetical protein
MTGDPTQELYRSETTESELVRLREKIHDASATRHDIRRFYLLIMADAAAERFGRLPQEFTGLRDKILANTATDDETRRFNLATDIFLTHGRH